MSAFQNLPNDLIIRIIKEADGGRNAHKTALMPCLKEIQVACEKITCFTTVDVFNNLSMSNKLTKGSVEMLVRDMDEREEAQLEFDLNDQSDAGNKRYNFHVAQAQAGLDRIEWYGWETPYGGNPWNYFHLSRLSSD